MEEKELQNQDNLETPPIPESHKKWWILFGVLILLIWGGEDLLQIAIYAIGLGYIALSAIFSFVYSNIIVILLIIIAIGVFSRRN